MNAGRMPKVPVDDFEYLMENEDEELRLDAKTDAAAVEEQATWAGLKAGMRVLDLGCGSGKTTSILGGLVRPGGSVVGVDLSGKRIEFARSHYTAKGIEFVRRDLIGPLDDLGRFDFAWVRFVLEYHRSESVEIVRNLSRILEPGGVLCLIDLDHNCLNHYGLPERLEKTIFAWARWVEENLNFDPYAGRKLYSYLYDLGYEDIAVKVSAHHVIYGTLKSIDAFNWMKKMEVVTGKSRFEFEEYKDGRKGLTEEFNRFFLDPRRFSYTPLICARGQKQREASMQPDG